jgi:plastocyanin
MKLLMAISSTLRWFLLLAVLLVPPLMQAQWRATVGAQTEDKGVQVLAFLPNEIWIHAGDSVTWTFETDEPHTVTFLTSGQTRLAYQVGCPGFSPDGSATLDGSTCLTTAPLIKGQTFTVTFPSVGNFKLVCLVHANMTGVVHVLSPSGPVPHDQDFYDDQAADTRHGLLSAMHHDGDHEGHDHDFDRSPSSEHEVIAGDSKVLGTAGGSSTVALARFMQPRIVIHAGETVEWSNVGPVASHTVTFGVEPSNAMPPSANVTVDADGARHAVITSPTDSVNSGYLSPSPQERVGLAQSPLGVTRFRVTFTKAGTYPYICTLHDNLGMIGTVIVLR